MKIPKIPAPDGISGKQWEGQSGKGSGRRPDAGHPLFKDKRAELPRNCAPGHTRIVYKDGVRQVWVNGVLTETRDLKTGKVL